MTVALAAALAAIIAFWAVRLLAPRPAIAPADVSVESGDAADTTLAARLFGGPAVATAAAAASSNVRVAGVVATGGRAVAVLSIDGQPGRAYGVGAALPDGSRVVRVRADSVWLERGGTRLELPAPARPSLAVLTAGRQAASTDEGQESPGAPASMPGAVPAMPGARAPVSARAAPAALPPPAAPTPDLPADATPPRPGGAPAVPPGSGARGMTVPPSPPAP